MGSLATSAYPWASTVSRRAPSSRGDGMRLANAQEEMQGTAIGHHEVQQSVTVEIIDEEIRLHGARELERPLLLPAPVRQLERGENIAALAREDHREPSVAAQVGDDRLIFVAGSEGAGGAAEGLGDR